MENNFTFTGTFNAAAIAVVLSVGMILALKANDIVMLIIQSLKGSPGNNHQQYSSPLSYLAKSCLFKIKA